MNIQVGEDVLVFAFRYALGRMSYAPHTVIECIIENLGELKSHTISQMDKEIGEYYDVDLTPFRPSEDDLEHFEKGRWLWLRNELRKEVIMRKSEGAEY